MLPRLRGPYPEYSAFGAGGRKEHGAHRQTGGVIRSGNRNRCRQRVGANAARDAVKAEGYHAETTPNAKPERYHWLTIKTFKPIDLRRVIVNTIGSHTITADHYRQISFSVNRCSNAGMLLPCSRCDRFGTMSGVAHRVCRSCAAEHGWWA